MVERGGHAIGAAVDRSAQVKKSEAECIVELESMHKFKGDKLN